MASSLYARAIDGETTPFVIDPRQQPFVSSTLHLSGISPTRERKFHVPHIIAGVDRGLFQRHVSSQGRASFEMRIRSLGPWRHFGTDYGCRVLSHGLWHVSWLINLIMCAGQLIGRRPQIQARRITWFIQSYNMTCLSLERTTTETLSNDTSDRQHLLAIHLLTGDKRLIRRQPNGQRISPIHLVGRHVAGGIFLQRILIGRAKDRVEETTVATPMSGVIDLHRDLVWLFPERVDGNLGSSGIGCAGER
jgi:hypothetical protein